jgi:hypothetical protein
MSGLPSPADILLCFPLPSLSSLPSSLSSSLPFLPSLLYYYTILLYLTLRQLFVLYLCVMCVMHACFSCAFIHVEKLTCVLLACLYYYGIVLCYVVIVPGLDCLYVCTCVCIVVNERTKRVGLIQIHFSKKKTNQKIKK